TWVDETPPFRFTNEPDELQVELYIDDGEEYILLATERGSGNDVAGGSATIQWYSPDPMKGQGLMVSVTAVACGDMVPFISIGG
ncbi:MAG: hypothetical protein GWN18_02285, partial [Thermoplasmata archaeon]|nr:hypothetical protein [Thermoplasmata archaeon]NIS10842.1 hypothetical protein [Thermoplasmata archaeon]NIS18774.1 hypothetical protein [Thermoplasmata archaeon]NIT75800.1 hypothetical protein [Thermoplasmata archaeon]NIU47934.1 hypothetical protein [Thermoplasmata archaeon]